MKYKINNFLIKLFHRKLRMPKLFVYNSIIIINKIAFSKINKLFYYLPRNNESKQCDHGYIIFKDIDNDALRGVIDTCNSIFEDKISNHSHVDFQNNPRKSFLLTIDSDYDLLSSPKIKSFVESEFVINNVSSILQAPFLINSARLWWSPANTSEVSSQLYHFDEEDLTQVKLFINITKVTESSGPFTFLSKEDSIKVSRNFRNGKRRFTDQDIYAFIGEDKAIQLTGNPGSGAFVDTSNCMHYGSRNNESDRLVLMMQFLRKQAPLITQSIRV